MPSRSRFRNILFAAAACGAASSSIAATPPLALEVYNPGEQGFFAVSSVLVTGQKEAVLIDTQFARSDAEKLVDKVRASGRTLTAIYISHGDPDYYFGLDVLHAAFPDAKVLASAPTIEHIKATAKPKLAYWGPILKDDAPKDVVVPDLLAGTAIDLEGRKLEIIGLDGPTPERSFVWIPSLQAVVGGIPVVGGQHVWMADTQTPQSHRQWLATLDRIEKLQPRIVVPGHFGAGAPQTLASVRFTRDYIKAYDAAAAKAKNSGELIAAMKARYPKLGADSSLELSAKVSKGEMKWP